MKEKRTGTKRNSKSHIENNKYTLDLVNGWINNADTKISISCGISSVVFAIILFFAENILCKLDYSKGINSCYIPWIMLFGIGGVGCFLVSLWFCFWALNPNLASSKIKAQNKDYSIFYEDIKCLTEPEYIASANDATDEAFNEEILREIHINSGICSKKMHRFKIGMWYSVISIVGIVVGSFLIYLAVNKI